MLGRTLCVDRGDGSFESCFVLLHRTHVRDAETNLLRDLLEAPHGRVVEGEFLARVDEEPGALLADGERDRQRRSEPELRGLVAPWFEAGVVGEVVGDLAGARAHRRAARPESGFILGRPRDLPLKEVVGLARRVLDANGVSVVVARDANPRQ